VKLAAYVEGMRGRKIINSKHKHNKEIYEAVWTEEGNVVKTEKKLLYRLIRVLSNGIVQLKLYHDLPTFDCIISSLLVQLFSAQTILFTPDS
jgi:hypothetical protein